LTTITACGQATYFNFGPPSSVPEKGYTHISNQSSPANFRWLEAPTDSIIWSDRYTSRSISERSGLAAPNISFQIELDPGRYLLQISFDAGMEDSTHLQIILNGEQVDPLLLAFKPPAEEYQGLKPQVRIWQKQLDVGQDDLTVSLINAHQKTRLLNCKVIPVCPPRSETELDLQNLIHTAGSYSSADSSLQSISEQLKILSPHSCWANYWQEQVALLMRAEYLFSLSGYESAKDRDRMTLIQRSQQIAMLLDPIAGDSTHLLYERALWLRSKIRFHLNLEYGGAAEKRTAMDGFRLLAAKYSADERLQMYLGHRIVDVSKDEIDLHASLAPDWAQWQIKAMARLKELVSYWVIERQDDSGEFGGKLGDDVEALRFWAPLIYTGDSLAVRGWSRLYDAVWNSSYIEDGYARKISDVEHASEFISDTEPAMMLISDDQEVHQRALHLRDHLDTLWSGINDRGERSIKSAWYSSNELDMRPPRNRDVDYNARALKALRYYLFRYPEAERTKILLQDWATTWRQAALRSDKNKPIGVLPPSIEFPSGKINGDEPTWYRANMFWEYFDFNGSALILDHGLFMSTMTNDSSLADPLLASLRLVNQHSDRLQEHFEEGSPGWAAQQFASNRHWWSVIAQWRILSNETTFDELLLAHGSDYIRYYITRNKEHLSTALEKLTLAMSYNWPMLTSESVFTDRIYGYYDEGLRRLETNALKAMLTGEAVLWGTSPYPVVTWELLDPATSVLVHPSADQTEITIYNHSENEKEIVGRFWQIESGDHLVDQDGIQVGSFASQDPGASIRIKVQPGNNRFFISDSSNGF